MLGIIFGLIAAFAQGLGHTLLKKSYDKRSASLAFFVDMIFGLLIWVPVAFVFGIQWDQIWVVFGYALLSALLAEAFVFFVLGKGDISLTQSVFSTYPLFTLLFSRFINGDTLTIPSLLAIVVIIVGIVTLGLPQTFDKSELKKRIILLWPLAGAIAVGVSDSLSKNILDQTSTGTFLFALAFAQIPVALGYLLVEKQRTTDIIDMFKNYRDAKYSFLGSFLLVVSLIFFWLAFTYTTASIASPVTGTAIVFTLLFASIFLKEKVVLKDKIGICLTVLGVLGLSFLVP
ncbi:DMT family transporter [bacterium]|nr:DMT family transporter [bacterium]